MESLMMAVPVGTIYFVVSENTQNPPHSHHTQWQSVILPPVTICSMGCSPNTPIPCPSPLSQSNGLMLRAQHRLSALHTLSGPSCLHLAELCMLVTSSKVKWLHFCEQEINRADGDDASLHVPPSLAAVFHTYCLICVFTSKSCNFFKLNVQHCLLI